MAYIKLSFTDRVDPTIEGIEWLQKAENELNAVFEKYIIELAAKGFCEVVEDNS